MPQGGFTIIGGDADREYLGLAPDATRFSLADLQGDYAVVVFFHSDCVVCIPGMQGFAALHEELARDGKTPISFAGIAVLDTNRAVAKFRKTYAIPFPLSADANSDLFGLTGWEAVPVAVVLGRTEDGGWEILDVREGGEEINEQLYGEIRSLALGMANAAGQEGEPE